MAEMQSLNDPLSEVTRKERRMLLGVSMLGIALVKMDLTPTKINTLGIEFAEGNQKAFLIIIGLIIIYFLAAFAIYSASDFLEWRKNIRSETVNRVLERAKKERELPSSLLNEEHNLINHYAKGGFFVYRLTGPVSAIRAFFEFILPIIVGAYSVFILFTSKINSA